MKKDPVLKIILKTLDDKKAEAVEVLDVRSLTPLCETYVIATADNIRKLNAIKETIVEEVEKSGESIHHVEGREDSGWILIDAYHILVHLFSPEQRERIDLDGLIKKALR